jgi:hypothetical protein
MNFCHEVRYLFILLAFYFHQIFELTDRHCQAYRKKFGSKRHMWEKLRTAVSWFVFESWELLSNFLLTPTKYSKPLTRLWPFLNLGKTP